MEPDQICRKLISKFLFYPGVVSELDIPQSSMDVIKGKMVTLKASYGGSGSDLSSNTVLWTFVANNTQQVRNGKEKVMPTAQD